MEQLSTTPVNDSPVTDAPADDTVCPRCGKALVDPHGLGWCQACGYCRSLDEDRTRLPLAPAASKANRVVLPAGAPVRMPRWGIMLLAGIVAVALTSWVVGRFIPLQPLHRALWATIQAAAGIVIMFVGQFYALFRIAPEEAALHFVDAVVPFRLYGLVCKRLPRMAIVLCVGSWGLTLTLSGLLLIGGMGHWLKYLPKSRESQQLQWK